jgi:hypothetical protein
MEFFITKKRIFLILKLNYLHPQLGHFGGGVLTGGVQPQLGHFGGGVGEGQRLNPANTFIAVEVRVNAS